MSKKLIDHSSGSISPPSSLLMQTCGMAAAEHMLLGATVMEIGSCWVSLYRCNAHEILELPMHEIVVGGLMLGHYKRGEEHGHDGHERDPLDGMYTFHE